MLYNEEWPWEEYEGRPACNQVITRHSKTSAEITTTKLYKKPHNKTEVLPAANKAIQGGTVQAKKEIK